MEFKADNVIDLVPLLIERGRIQEPPEEACGLKFYLDTYDSPYFVVVDRKQVLYVVSLEEGRKLLLGLQICLSYLEKRKIGKHHQRLGTCAGGSSCPKQPIVSDSVTATPYCRYHSRKLRLR